LQTTTTTIIMQLHTCFFGSLPISFVIPTNNVSLSTDQGTLPKPNDLDSLQIIPLDPLYIKICKGSRGMICRKYYAVPILLPGPNSNNDLRTNKICFFFFYFCVRYATKANHTFLSIWFTFTLFVTYCFQTTSPNLAKTMHPGIGGDQIYGERASPSLIPSTGRQHQATWSPKNRQQSQASTQKTAGEGWQLLNSWPAKHCFQPTNAHTVQLRGQY